MVAQTVKNPPVMQETWVQSLGWEDPLEEGLATHSSILAWRIPMDRGAWQAPVFLPVENPRGERSVVGYSPWSHKDSDMTEQLSFHSTFGLPR